MLLISLAAAWYMVGLVAFVQTVAYPQFGRVGAAEFVVYHKAHTTWTGVAVLPVMLIELVTAIGLVAGDTHAAWRWFSLALVGVAWAATFFEAVPMHERLKTGYDAAALRRLLIANAVRGVAWAVRGCLLLWAVSGSLPR